MGRKWQSPAGFMPLSTSQNDCYHYLCHCSESQLQLTSARGPSIQAGGSGPVSYGFTVFFPGSCCTCDLVCSLQECSFCLPQCCGVPGNKSTWPSKSDFLGALPPVVRPQPGKPDMGLRTFIPVGKHL